MGVMYEEQYLVTCLIPESGLFLKEMKAGALGNIPILD